jgi:hypothetical protein
MLNVYFFNIKSDLSIASDMHIKKNSLITKDSWIGNFLQNKNYEYIEQILG